MISSLDCQAVIDLFWLNKLIRGHRGTSWPTPPHTIIVPNDLISFRVTSDGCPPEADGCFPCIPETDLGCSWSRGLFQVLFNTLKACLLQSYQLHSIMRHKYVTSLASSLLTEEVKSIIVRLKTNYNIYLLVHGQNSFAP